MWYLSSENDARVIYVISQAQQIVIGRSVDNQQCNFAITSDPSISRRHATLTVRDNNLILQDAGSRYGTFINNSTDKIEINTDIQLKINDIVKFGKMNSVWKVNAITFNTCTSTLKGENLQRLKLTLTNIGGLLKNEWDDTCNYLTMPSITLTIKVVLALIQGSYIVSPEYWLRILESVNNLTNLPDPQKFIPAVTESTLNKEVVSFLPDLQRKSLFKDKKFIFLSKRQFDMYRLVLLKSGASPLLLSDCNFPISMLGDQNIIVIQSVACAGTQENNVETNDIISNLKNKGKRVIADAEIGLAILYCSTEKYCNPSFSFTSEVVKESAPLPKASKILAQESQEAQFANQNKENVKINETYGSDDKNNFDLSGEKLTSKRKLSDFTSELEFNPNKKVATTCHMIDLPSESTKRRLSGGESSLNPPKKMAIDKGNIEQVSLNSSDLNMGKSPEMFNFINEAQDSSENKIMKLNLTRPQKRKLGASSEEGGLFNFVQSADKECEGESTDQSIFPSNKHKKQDVDVHIVKSNVTVTSEDISAMRGCKLKELMENNKFSPPEFSIKEECVNLEDKMSGLNLGNTVVIVCSNLIVKKEPFVNGQDVNFVKNFKKFKKVWPIRRQNTTVADPSVNIAETADTYSVEF